MAACAIPSALDSRSLSPDVTRGLIVDSNADSNTNVPTATGVHAGRHIRLTTSQTLKLPATSLPGQAPVPDRASEPTLAR